MFEYAELHAHSAFSFLDGADQPEDLVAAAQELGLSGLAVLDFTGFYGAIRTNQAGRDTGLPIVHGAEVITEEDFHLPILARGPEGYRRLSKLISQRNLAAGQKTELRFSWEELAEASGGNWLILTGTGHGPLRGAKPEAQPRLLEKMKSWFGRENVAVESTLLQIDGEAGVGPHLLELARSAGLPLVATTAARLATPGRRPLGDVLTATRMNLTLEEAQGHLPAARAFLRSPAEMMQLHSYYPQAVANAAALARECAFDLKLITPRLPLAKIPAGYTQSQWLKELVYQGARGRYGTRQQNPRAWQVIDHELEIIERLDFCGYFLIVWDIVQFCRSQNILCQGRGSAANSAVCFSLGITAVDAVRHQMLFERFLSPNRVDPPDIDLDIEAIRREEVIQYVYSTYGREHCAQVANVITYRPRSALRDVARVFAVPEAEVSAWSKDFRSQIGRDLEKVPGVPGKVLKLAEEMQKLPRHLGLHSGGMILTRQPVTEICPVQWAASPGRSCLQWDKEDCAEAGLVKFDLLGLGMLTALRKSFNWLGEAKVRGTDGQPLSLYNLPPEDPQVYELLQRADTIGVFQVESRAQMNTLPRLRPECFYDLVIEVALIRPGPIQGQAVNPYLRRRRGREQVSYIHPLVRPALEKTLGVAIFQEQLMQVSIDAAGFTPVQADELRKAMSAKRSEERMERLRPALMAGMEARGIGKEQREEIYRQLHGFSEFGFPESHAFSFAYIVYASAWLKVHYPAYFYAGILASQPMGFYSPQTLVGDARRHEVAVWPADVNHSSSRALPLSEAGGDVPLAPDFARVAGLQIGLEQVRGLAVETARKIASERESGGVYRGVSDLAVRANLTGTELELLAAAGALASLGVSRGEGLWQAEALGQVKAKKGWYQPYLPGTEPILAAPELPKPNQWETLRADLRATGMSTRTHPCALLRESLARHGVTPIWELRNYPGQRIRIAGVITHRQRPHTAKGTTFLSLEDETGLANVICTTGFWKAFYPVVSRARAVVVRGVVQEGDGAFALQADYLEPLEVPTSGRSRDFR